MEGGRGVLHLRLASSFLWLAFGEEKGVGADGLVKEEVDGGGLNSQERGRC